MLAVALVVVLVGAAAWLGGRATATSPAQADTRGPGPTSTEAGVPVGYANSQAGAVAAALNLLAALYGPGLDPDQQDRVIGMLAADGAEEWITDHLREIDAHPLPEEFHGRVRRWAPVGYAVTSYSDERAVVRVWSTASRTSQTGRTLESGATLVSSLELVWRGDWSISRARVLGEGQEGLDEELDGMGRVWHAPQR